MCVHTNRQLWNRNIEKKEKENYGYNHIYFWFFIYFSFYDEIKGDLYKYNIKYYIYWIIKII